MSVMPDTWIREMATKHGMIEPFTEKLQREGVISYGLSSYGYDARVAPEFKIFTNVDSAVVDPKQFSDKSFVDRETDICVIPPIPLPWPARWNISAFRVTPWSSVWASPPMPAAASSST